MLRTCVLLCALLLPVSLQAQTLQPVTVVWDPSATATGYRVAVNGVIYGETAKTSFPLSLYVGQTYVLSVTAFNAEGESTASVTHTVQSPAPQPPPADPPPPGDTLGTLRQQLDHEATWRVGQLHDHG